MATPRVIALAGKGGTGKTTTAALLLKYLVARQKTPVLLVDADPNANLNELLGLKVGLTVGEVRKEIKGEIPAHISRDQFMEMKLHQALIEETGFDLLVMGQPDGPGCYCAANQFLAMSMDRLASNYQYILVDNEAGMEHLSRLNLTAIDHLLVLSDPSARGVMTAGRIAEIIKPLRLKVAAKWLIVNRMLEPPPAALVSRIEETVREAGLPLAGFIPASDDLVNRELSGDSYLGLDPGLPLLRQAYAVFDRIFGAG